MQAWTLPSPFRVLIHTERGNCLFDYNPSNLPFAMDTKDLCKLIASLGHFTELDDFCFLHTALESYVVRYIGSYGLLAEGKSCGRT